MLFVLSTLFRMGFFGTADRWGTGKKVPSLKPVYTYPAMMKLSTVTPYLKKIQKIYIYVPRHLALLTLEFFIENQQLLSYQERQM